MMPRIHHPNSPQHPFSAKLMLGAIYYGDIYTLVILIIDWSHTNNHPQKGLAKFGYIVREETINI
jgi:hypothetical protein